MNRIVLIIPYFGTFNNYFHLWIESANRNKNIDFLIISDNEKPEICEDNIIFQYMEFEELKERIIKICGVKNAKLRSPYKLCEYKLFYGKIFEKEIINYEFWGFCDVDLIFGNFDYFITNELLNEYDKFYSRGHLTILRNNEFFRNLCSIDDHRMRVNKKIAWTTNHCVHFDELPCWNEIIKENGYRCYDDVDFCDIAIDSFRFKLAMGNENPYSKQIFLYDHGNLKRYYIDENGKLINKNVLYVHLQKRNMKIQTSNTNIYLIVPNEFVNYEQISFFSLNKYSKEKKIWFSYVIRRIKEILKNIKNGALTVRLIVFYRRNVFLWKKLLS